MHEPDDVSREGIPDGTDDGEHDEGAATFYAGGS